MKKYGNKTTVLCQTVGCRPLAEPEVQVKGQEQKKKTGNVPIGLEPLRSRKPDDPSSLDCDLTFLFLGLFMAQTLERMQGQRSREAERLQVETQLSAFHDEV